MRNCVFVAGMLGAVCGALLGAAWAEIQLVLDFDPEFSAFPPPPGLLRRCASLAALVGLAAGVVAGVACIRLKTRRSRLAVVLLAGALLGADVPFLHGWSLPQGRPILLGTLGALLAVTCYWLVGNALDSSDQMRRTVFPQFSLRGMLAALAVVCAALAMLVSTPGKRWHARRLLAESGFRVLTSSDSPEWVVWLVGVRTRNYLVRLHSIQGRLPPKPAADLLAAFEQFPEIEELQVEGVSDADLRHFAGMRRLRRLTLSGSQLRGSGLKYFDALRHLEHLNLRGADLSDGLDSLKDLPSLTFLEASQSALTDSGLKGISRFPQLEALHLRQSKVTDGCLRHLAGLARLKTLGLSNCPVGDAGLSALGDVPALRRLSLAETQITDAGINYLSRAHKLAVVDFNGTNVTDAGLMQLVCLTKLRFVFAAATGITQNGVDKFHARRSALLATRLVSIHYLPFRPGRLPPNPVEVYGDDE